jgi:benzoylformate decarboxylase
LTQRTTTAAIARPQPAPLPPPAPSEPLRAGHVFDALAARLPRDAIVVEESPSSRPELSVRVPTRAPMGFVSAAMGGLGFSLPGTTGLRMALPDRPVLTISGDGSSMYAIQALWSAARYGVGALFLVMSNGRYAVMDALAANTGKDAPWPGFEGIDIAAMARALGCPAERVETHEELLARFDEVLPTLAERNEPLLLEIVVAPR